MAAIGVPAAVRRHLSADGLAGAVVAAAGRVAGAALSVRHLVPGAVVAVGLPVGLGGIAGHVLGHGLTPWVALTTAALLALALDRRL